MQRGASAVEIGGKRGRCRGAGAYMGWASSPASPGGAMRRQAPRVEGWSSKVLVQRQRAEVVPSSSNGSSAGLHICDSADPVDTWVDVGHASEWP